MVLGTLHDAWASHDGSAGEGGGAQRVRLLTGRSLLTAGLRDVARALRMLGKYVDARNREDKRLRRDVGTPERVAREKTTSKQAASDGRQRIGYT